MSPLRIGIVGAGSVVAKKHLLALRAVRASADKGQSVVPPLGEAQGRSMPLASR